MRKGGLHELEDWLDELDHRQDANAVPEAMLRLGLVVSGVLIALRFGYVSRLGVGWGGEQGLGWGGVGLWVWRHPGVGSLVAGDPVGQEGRLADATA